MLTLNLAVATQQCFIWTTLHIWDWLRSKNPSLLLAISRESMAISNTEEVTMKSICHTGHETHNTHLSHACNMAEMCLLGTRHNMFLGVVCGYHSQVIHDASWAGMWTQSSLYTALRAWLPFTMRLLHPGRTEDARQSTPCLGAK